LLGVVPAALLYLWLRARTGSLAAPIIAHVVWNLSVVLLNG
jgi:membrane protease YdiL (CAAX protease family)